MSNRLASLSACELFANFSEKELKAIKELLKRTTFEPGKLIIEDGSAATYIYIIWAGRCEIFKSDNQGANTYTLATLGPGNFFGEMALIDGGKRSSNVRAIDDVEALVISAKDLYHLSDNPKTAPLSAKMGINLAKVLVQRLRDTNEQAINALHGEHVQATLRKAQQAGSTGYEWVS